MMDLRMVLWFLEKCIFVEVSIQYNQYDWVLWIYFVLNEFIGDWFLKNYNFMLIC